MSHHGASVPKRHENLHHDGAIDSFAAWQTRLCAGLSRTRGCGRIRARGCVASQSPHDTLQLGELKQTVVDGMKAAHADGKLTQGEISELGSLLYEKTTAKLSDSALNVLTAAQVDISALITGAAEQLIASMKK